MDGSATAADHTVTANRLLASGHGNNVGSTKQRRVRACNPPTLGGRARATACACRFTATAVRESSLSLSLSLPFNLSDSVDGKVKPGRAAAVSLDLAPCWGKDNVNVVVRQIPSG